MSLKYTENKVIMEEFLENLNVRYLNFQQCLCETEICPFQDDHSKWGYLKPVCTAFCVQISEAKQAQRCTFADSFS